ncbi:MAG: radical SAM protein, partial [Betaproteobacteria bacterium]
KELFKDWLDHNYPLKAAHVMSRVRQMRDGKENDPNFGTRHRGTGLIADLLSKRFDAACRRLNLNQERTTPKTDTSQFRPPRAPGQMDLF